MHPKDKRPTPAPETFRQVDIKITMDVPGTFLVNVKADGEKGVRSQVCDSQDEVREFVSSIL